MQTPADRNPMMPRTDDDRDTLQSQPFDVEAQKANFADFLSALARSPDVDGHTVETIDADQYAEALAALAAMETPHAG